MKPSVRAAVFARDGRKCVLCGYEGPHLAIDHIHPQARGGTDDLDNLRVLCRACNSQKAGATDRFVHRVEREAGWLRQIQLNLDDELADRITRRCRQEGISRNEWINRALQYVTEQPVITITRTETW